MYWNSKQVLQSREGQCVHDRLWLWIPFRPLVFEQSINKSIELQRVFMLIKIVYI
jgi:hypothetical protein